MRYRVRYRLLASGLCLFLSVSLSALGQDINFGDVQLGSYKDSTATVQNPLPVPVTVTASYMKNNPSDFSIIAGAAPFTIPAGGTHYIGLRFKPTALGIRTDSLVLEGPYPGSPFYVWLQGRGVPVPVELAAFTATRTDDGVVLRWTTATETNNYGFEIQRSPSESAGFQTIGFLPGKGTSVDEQYYVFFDRGLANIPPATRTLTYRIKQVDFDGTATFFYAPPIRLDEMKVEPEEFEVYVFPNPFRSSPTLMLRNAGAVSQPIRVRIFDAMGRTTADLQVKIADRKVRSSSVPLDRDLFPCAGTYFISVTSVTGTKLVRVHRLNR
ncbi:MAG: T9SS type A sorting domain-containing protein [Chlorobi bacterium]|nr:T9SS type A sorting domain-containing protein [Chlorobiota bacterium]